MYLQYNAGCDKLIVKLNYNAGCDMKLTQKVNSKLPAVIKRIIMHLICKLPVVMINSL